MMKKKKQSRSQSSTKKTLEPSSDSSPSPRLLSIIRSKMLSGKDLKHMLRGMRSKTVPGLSSQSRIVRCPKCHKLLQEPLDATSYKCSGCDSILHAKSLELEGNDKKNTIPEALFSSQNRSLSTEADSAQGGSRTPMRSTQREYNSRASPSVERGYHSETVYKHETSDVRREWMRRADEFSVTGDSDASASARSSPYNTRSNASQWTQHEEIYEDPPRVPFYPASPSPSSAYEYGYKSPLCNVSASEQSYYHHQPNQFKQYGREGWFQESSVASPTRFQGETSEGKYYHRSSQSQLHDLQYQNLYEPNSSASPHRSVYDERSYQADAAPHLSTYSERSVGISKSDTSRDKKRIVKKRNLVMKRHILPTAGGAPFATCSYCLELLQLPQVSPHGKQKRYQVRCGSCSGVLRFSVPGNVDTVLDSPSFVDYGMGFEDETATNHQDFASDINEYISPDGSHLPCLDDDFEDTICKSNHDDVIFTRSPETFEDKGIKENIRNTSIKCLDSKVETLEPSLKSLVNHRLEEKQPASSETIGKTSRIHLEQSLEYENNVFIKPEKVVAEGSDESLEVLVDKKERMRQSSEEVERVPERAVSHSVEPLYKNVYVCETPTQSENTRDTPEFDGEKTQENESTWKEIMGDTPGLHCDKSSSYGENFEDTSVKKDTEHISYTFSDSKSTFIVPLAKASETFKTIIKGEIGEKRLVFHEMDSSNENVENSYGTLEPEYLEGSGYAGEETWDETMGDRAGLHLEEYESNYENYSKPFEWTSERATTCMHDCELGTILVPDEDVDGISEHSSMASLIDHGSSEERVMFHEPQDAEDLSNTVLDIVRSDLQELTYETNETLESSKMVGDGSVVSVEKSGETIIGETSEESSVSHQMESGKKNKDNSYGTVEPFYLEGSRLESDNPWAETMGDGAGLNLEECKSNPFEWTSERSPTFCLHEYEVGTVPELEESANGKPVYSSQDSFKDHGNFNEKVVSHEEEPWLVDENKTAELKVGVMVEAGPSLLLEDCDNDQSMKLEEKLEWTSKRAPTFRLHEYELGSMLESDASADGRSDYSSRGSFNDHEISKEREFSNEEDLQLVSDGKTEALQVDEIAEDANGRSESSSKGSFNDRGSSKQRAAIQDDEPWVIDDYETKALKVGVMAEDSTLELSDDIFMLSLEDTLEQERMTFHSSMFQENLMQTFNQGVSRVSSEGQESPSKMAELDSDTDEETSGEYLEHTQKENEKSGLTSKPYAHIYSTAEPSEIVGLRHALYQTQCSPLRSPLTSPIHTPIGSPLHYLMASQIRSPIASPIHSHIVSPLRSPIKSSGSLSDVLFFGK